ncbi:DUF2726 domain-containing protein [Clostridium sp. K04]|jgi:very-short-patch-repair endonuclease|uniref:DUF2726 domain-containing protein n=1 Tax=Clostridium sp. K04 TaxID=2718929 RepID=UPI001C8C8241|nr:DUF2726 domain-containing protein [Clostridium sp. K04]MBX9185257.1 DUF2726 domain-containing protein [Clostridium sp. K04]
MEFLIVCIIIAYLLYKNNSLKKSSSNLNQKTYKINIEQNNNSNVKQNYKSTEEKIESIKKSTYYYKEKKFWDSSLEKEVYFYINDFIKNKSAKVEILPHVSLRELFKPTNDFKNQNLKQLSSYHIDVLLLSEKSFVPLVAIEIDGSHHELSDSQKIRDAFKTSLLERNGIKLLRLKPDNCNYDFIESELINLLTTSSIYCPECGSEMIKKSNKKTGEKFLGCSGFHSLGCRCSKSIDYKVI